MDVYIVSTVVLKCPHASMEDEARQSGQLFKGSRQSFSSQLIYCRRDYASLRTSQVRGARFCLNCSKKFIIVYTLFSEAVNVL